MESLWFDIPGENRFILLRSLQNLYNNLRQNQPDLKDVDMIEFHWNHRNFHFTNQRAIELGDALRDNTIVEKIEIDLKEMTLRGTGDLAHYVATSSSLKELRMIAGGSRKFNVYTPQILAVVDRFLSAVAYNGNLSVLQIPQIFGSVPMSTALRANRNSLKQLELSFRDFTTSISQGMKNEALIVAGTIGNLHKLERIDILCQSDSCFTTKIILKLRNHPTLQEFILEMDDVGIDNAPIRAFILQGFFRSARSLRKVVLKSYSFQNEFVDVLPMIVSGLYHNQTIRSLTLDFRTNMDENANAVCRLLQNNPGIIDLRVRVDSLHGFSLVLRSLDANETLLFLHVSITKPNIMDNRFDMEACRLRLKTAFASMKHLRAINFDLERNSENIPFPSEILQGLEANDVLTHIYFDWENHNIDEELKLAKYYAARNYWSPKLHATTNKNEVINLFVQIKQKEEEKTYLTIVYETLHRKDIVW